MTSLTTRVIVCLAAAALLWIAPAAAPANAGWKEAAPSKSYKEASPSKSYKEVSPQSRKGKGKGGKSKKK